MSYSVTVPDLSNNEFQDSSSIYDASHLSLNKKDIDGISSALKYRRPIQRDTDSTYKPIDSGQNSSWPIYEESPIINLPDRARVQRSEPSNSFHALQEWEGYVLEANEDEFTARLVDLTAGVTQEDEETTIPLEEVAENDHKRICPGSIFRWVIGYENLASGNKRRVSQIVFRDLPLMSKWDISEGKEWAQGIVESIKD